MLPLLFGEYAMEVFLGFATAVFFLDFFVDWRQLQVSALAFYSNFFER